MPRREYRSAFTCADPECKDTQFLVHYTIRDQNAAYARQHKNPYRCTRHADPDKYLRPGNEHTRYVAVATRRPSGLYWVPEGAATGSGYAFGPGFNAHASDFPEGTRLVVTAQIEMPA